MGFFSEIVSEARQSNSSGTSVVSRPSASPAPVPAPSSPVPASPVSVLAPPSSGIETAPVVVPPEQQTAPVPVPAAPSTSKPEVEPVAAQPEQPAIDLTADAEAADEAERRRDHEAAEAKRKAEFDAKQAEKQAKRQAALDRIAAMNHTELLAASVERVATDTEKLTRRNMKEAVAEHIQAKCREDTAFAMLVMEPEKSMIHCFQFINRKAREYAEQEMKDNGIERTGTYGCDVPDGLCFQWAEDYFRDQNAKEDHKDDEKFVPKTYVPATRKKTQGKTAKKPVPAEKPKVETPADTGSMEQISLI